MDLASLNLGQTGSCIFSGRCFVSANYFPARKSIPQAVTFAHIVYYWVFILIFFCGNGLFLHTGVWFLGKNKNHIGHLGS